MCLQRWQRQILLPAREQFVALWRAIERLEQEGCPCAPRLPTLRRLAGVLDGSDSFLRAVLAVEVFAERGLVSLAVEEESIRLHPIPDRKADLEQSVYMIRLRRALANEERGGR